jgi:hypothetical protein
MGTWHATPLPLLDLPCLPALPCLCFTCPATPHHATPRHALPCPALPCAALPAFFIPALPHTGTHADQPCPATCHGCPFFTCPARPARPACLLIARASCLESLSFALPVCVCAACVCLSVCLSVCLFVCLSVCCRLPVPCCLSHCLSLLPTTHSVACPWSLSLAHPRHAVARISASQSMLTGLARLGVQRAA